MRKRIFPSFVNDVKDLFVLFICLLGMISLLGCGNEDEETNLDPIAVIEAEVIPLSDNHIQVEWDASKSYDPDGGEVSIEWGTFDGSDFSQISAGPTYTTFHQLDTYNSGSYSCVLLITDDEGSQIISERTSFYSAGLSAPQGHWDNPYTIDMDSGWQVVSIDNVDHLGYRNEGKDHTPVIAWGDVGLRQDAYITLRSKSRAIAAIIGGEATYFITVGSYVVPVSNTPNKTKKFQIYLEHSLHGFGSVLAPGGASTVDIEFGIDRYDKNGKFLSSSTFSAFHKRWSSVGSDTINDFSDHSFDEYMIEGHKYLVWVRLKTWANSKAIPKLGIGEAESDFFDKGQDQHGQYYSRYMNIPYFLVRCFE